VFRLMARAAPLPYFYARFGCSLSIGRTPRIEVGWLMIRHPVLIDVRQATLAPIV